MTWFVIPKVKSSLQTEICLASPTILMRDHWLQAANTFAKIIFFLFSLNIFSPTISLNFWGGGVLNLFFSPTIFNSGFLFFFFDDCFLLKFVLATDFNQFFQRLIFTQFYFFFDDCSFIQYFTVWQTYFKLFRLN